MFPTSNLYELGLRVRFLTIYIVYMIYRVRVRIIRLPNDPAKYKREISLAYSTLRTQRALIKSCEVKPFGRYTLSNRAVRGSHARCYDARLNIDALFTITCRCDVRCRCNNAAPMALGKSAIDWGIFISVRAAVVFARVRMVQTLMAELRVLIGKRPQAGMPPPTPPLPPQQQYSRRELKANLHRHMSIVLDR